MLVRIKRQDDRNSSPYYQEFSYDGNGNITVSALLDELNYADDLYDINGNPCRRIRWECSCSQKMCGACAMIINGIPSLACATFLKDLKGDTVTIEPLSKFPVISDLMVDRSIIAENLKNAGIFLGEYKKIRPKDYPHLYSVARCLKCGLCLEACPNYVKGDNFFGAQFANESYLMSAQSADRAKDIKREYDKHFPGGCSKAFACEKVCPMEIETLTSIAKLNR